MATINAGAVYRFENGGTIQWGSDTVANFKVGTLKVDPGGVKPVKYTAAGAAKMPIAGDSEYTKVGLTLMIGAGDMSTLMAAFSAQLGAGTNVFAGKTLIITAKDPADTTKASTFTLANCFIPVLPKYRPGSDMDTVEIELESIEPDGVWDYA